MIAASKKRLNRSGFTLVEVIVTIMAAAILGAIFINYMGTAMSQSARAIEIVRDEAGAEALIEQIVADYVYELNRNPSTTSPTALSTLKGYIEPPTLKYGAKVSAQYIKYKDDLSGDEENPPPALSNTLKVTVAASGNDLITLLTQSRVETKNPAVPF